MPLSRTYTTPAAPSTIQPASTTTGKAALRRPFSGVIRAIALILTSVISAASAQEPPENLARLVAHRESETEAERNQYMYRQTVTLDELDDHGAMRGQYKEVRDIIFSPAQERTEESVGKPLNSLKNLIMTPEDFRDIRDIQPLVLTEDRLWNYETRFKGEETVDGVDCWVLQVRPRQILGDLLVLRLGDDLAVAGAQHVRVVVPQHRVDARFAGPLHHPDRIRPLGDQVAHQHDPVLGGLITAREQRQELVQAAMNVADDDRPPLFGQRAAPRVRIRRPRR